jgi:hypothetical protein
LQGEKPSWESTFNQPDTFMKQIIFLVFILFTMRVLHAQDDYSVALQDNISKLDTTNDVMGLSQLAARFSAIYQAKKDWHPLYYQSLCFIRLGGTYTNVEQKKNAVIKAGELLDSLPADNDEVLVLRALYALTYLGIDRSVWQTYLPMINQSLEKAQALNANNPRIYYIQGILKYNMPASMGGGQDAGLRFLRTAMEKFQEINVKDEFAPTWGKKETEKLLRKG